MDKIDKILTEIVLFFRYFLRTYFNIVFRPRNFFLHHIENKSNELTNFINYITFLLISTFLLIFAVNIFPLFANFFQIYTKKFSMLLLTFIELDARQIVIITLPTSLFIYLYTKLNSLLIRRTDFRLSYARLISYLISSFFLTYFFSFLFLITASKMYFFLMSHIGIENTDVIEKIASSIIWVIIVLYSLYVIVFPTYSLFKIIRSKTKHLKIPILTAFSIVILVGVSVFIGVKQKEYDKIFDPLKSYEIDIKFMAINGGANITFKNETRPETRGGKEDISPPLKKDILFAPKDKSSMYIYLDMIVTNNSPDLIMLTPMKCATLTIDSRNEMNSSVSVVEKIILDLVTKDLDFSYLDSLEKPYVQDCLMLFPGETQWLHLKGAVTTEVYRKLSYIYVFKIDKEFSNYYYQVELNSSIKRSDKYDRTINFISKPIDLKIQDFKPDSTMANDMKKSIESAQNNTN